MSFLSALSFMHRHVRGAVPCIFMHSLWRNALPHERTGLCWPSPPKLGGMSVYASAWGLLWVATIHTCHLVLITNLNPTLSQLANNNQNLGEVYKGLASLHYFKRVNHSLGWKPHPLLYYYHSPLPQWVTTPISLPSSSCAEWCFLHWMVASSTDTSTSLWLRVSFTKLITWRC